MFIEIGTDAVSLPHEGDELQSRRVYVIEQMDVDIRGNLVPHVPEVYGVGQQLVVLRISQRVADKHPRVFTLNFHPALSTIPLSSSFSLRSCARRTSR